MASLSIAQYTKNKNIRQSLAFNSKTGLFYYRFEWITKEKVDELLPIELPYVNSGDKGENADVSKRFVHNQKSYR